MLFLPPLIGFPILIAIFLMLYGNYQECKLLVKVSTKLDKLLEAQGIMAMDIMIKRAHYKLNKPRLIRLVDRQLDLMLGSDHANIQFRRSLPFTNTISSEIAYRRLLRKLSLYIHRNHSRIVSIPKRKYRSQIIFISPVLFQLDKKVDLIMKESHPA